MLGWLAERRKERSGVRFSQPPKGTDKGPNVQIFFYFFLFSFQNKTKNRKKLETKFKAFFKPVEAF